VQTNIFMIDVASTGISAPDWVMKLREKSIWISALDSRTLRAVTHLDVSREDMLQAAEAFREVVRG
jgi:threonine aldolase